MVISRVPLTATAFRFLEPITAPIPVLPAEFFMPVRIAENLTKFSPAKPILAT